MVQKVLLILQFTKMVHISLYELNRILSDEKDIQQLFWDLLTNFNLLNEFGKKEAVKQIELFSKIPDYRKDDDKQE